MPQHFNLLRLFTQSALRVCGGPWGHRLWPRSRSRARQKWSELKSPRNQLFVSAPMMSLRHASATVSLPKPGRLHWLNEDATFAAHPFYGVFDGVSSARDSRAYARQLASSSRAALLAARDEPWPSAARSALTSAIDEAARIAGASTACLIKVDTENQLLFSYNLGDSGFLLFAPPGSSSDSTAAARISARSPPMLHAGGAPYQLAGPGYWSDKPSDGRAATHPLVPGCVAVLHSDGLLDNLSTQEVGEIIASKQPGDVDGIARTLATRASERKVRPDDVSVTAVSFASGGSSKGYGRRAVAANTALALGVATTTVGATSGEASAAEPEPAVIEVTDVIKVYGRLAGGECFGKSVPKASGASCQMTLEHAIAALGLDSEQYRDGMDERQFLARLEALSFEWPLKPWGAAKSESSNAKTATMNKSAETAVFMAELERRGLYDRRNPTGPLPTSLRTALDQQMQEEGVGVAAARKCFGALVGGGVTEPGALLTAERLERTIRASTGGETALDYYSFQALIGQSSRVVWPTILP